MSKLKIKSNITQMLKQVLDLNVEFDGSMGARGGAIIIHLRREVQPGEVFWQVPQEKWDAEGKLLGKMIDCPHFRVYQNKTDANHYVMFYAVKGEIRGWVDFKVSVGGIIYMQFCNLREPAASMDKHNGDFDMIKKEIA